MLNQMAEMAKRSSVAVQSDKTIQSERVSLESQGSNECIESSRRTMCWCRQAPNARTECAHWVDNRSIDTIQDVLDHSCTM